MNWHTSVSGFDWTLTTIVNLLCGLLSGWLSGWLVTRYYRKRDEIHKKIELEVASTKEASELLYGIHARLYFIRECLDVVSEERMKEIVAEDLHPIPQKLKKYELGPRAEAAKVNAFRTLEEVRSFYKKENSEPNAVAVIRYKLLKASFDLVAVYKKPFE